MKCTILKNYIKELSYNQHISKKNIKINFSDFDKTHDYYDKKFHKLSYYPDFDVYLKLKMDMRTIFINTCKIHLYNTLYYFIKHIKYNNQEFDDIFENFKKYIIKTNHNRFDETSIFIKNELIYYWNESIKEINNI